MTYFRGRSLVFGVVVLGCSGGPHVDFPKDQIWTSAHFRYGARADDLNVCSSVVEQLEAHFQAIGSYLGLVWTGGVIDYYKFRDHDDFHSNSGCHPSATACAKPTDVRSTRALDGHELIHVYTGPLGHPPALFEEGLAEALAPEGRSFMAPHQSWREILAMPPQSDGTWPVVDYAGGAWFITHLLRRFGPTPFVALYKAAGANHAADEIARQFHSIYGLDLDEVWSQAQSGTPRLAGIPVWECASAQPMVLGGDALPAEESCDGHGAYAGLALPSPTTLTWSEDSKPYFTISGCPAESGFCALVDDFDYQPGAVALPVGKYYVAPDVYRATPDAADLTRASVKLREASGVLGPDCGSLTPFVVGPGGYILVVVIANSADPWFALPQIPAGKSLYFAGYPADQRPFGQVAATVELCDSCQGPCRLVDSTSDLQASSGMVLRYTNLTSFEGAVVTRVLYTWR